MEAANISRITVERDKRGGKPCIRGLRITVWDVPGWLSLLFDENLSARLTARPLPLFPGCIRVRDVGLKQASDREISLEANRRSK